MAMTLLEKIIAGHSGRKFVAPGEIVNVEIDARVARDFGGAAVVRNLGTYGLGIADPEKTLFTFDCNPTGSDQKYAANQHLCRRFAREKGIRVFDIDAGIGTHLLIDEGYVFPGATAVSTDSHANILGAVGAFGQGMGDVDIAAAWHEGKVWFKVPHTVKIILEGAIPGNISSKDIVLNLLGRFGASSLLGYSVEVEVETDRALSLDDRITISSMATELGAVIILFPPSEEIKAYCSGRTGKHFTALMPDSDAFYHKTVRIEVAGMKPLIARPGAPHDTVPVSEVQGTRIDSAFIGSCTNGRMSDMIAAASILKERKVAPWVVLKIVPATDSIWKECLDKGLIEIFKKAGAMVSNAGCAGCAAGQVGQNGPGEVTVSTGNRNFPGKQGRGDVYLASPAVVAASAIAGFITTPENIPDAAALLISPQKLAETGTVVQKKPAVEKHATVLEGRIRMVKRDNIDTDMIYHNRYLAITEKSEMGRYSFDNMEGFMDFAKNTKPGDIIVTGKNFGCGSSRQQAVDCFISLGIQAVIAESFAVIYERNAINAAFPVVSAPALYEADLTDGDIISMDLKTGEIKNYRTGETYLARPFSEVQLNIYERGGLLA